MVEQKLELLSYRRRPLRIDLGIAPRCSFYAFTLASNDWSFLYAQRILTDLRAFLEFRRKLLMSRYN